MTRCTRCHRPMKAPSPSGFGPVCARAMLGAKPARVAKAPVKRDAMTSDLFEVAHG